MMKPVIPSILNSGAPVEYECDWGKIARLIVHDSLKTQPGEEVIIHADPTYFPALTEQVRIELVRADEIADWVDRNQWNEIDYIQVGKGVHADLVIALDVESFRLREGATLFKGKASVHTTVFDIGNGGAVVFESSTFEFAYPENGARHSTETNESSFRRLFIRSLARHLAKDFFAYDRQEDFAYDATSISGN